MNKTLLTLGATTLIAAFSGSAAHAQAWPSKPIHIVVPYTPGGSSDIIARAISQPLSEALKTTVIVENRPGANGNTGTDSVAKARADGYTLLLCDVQGAEVYTMSPTEFAPFFETERKRWAGVVAKGNLKLD